MNFTRSSMIAVLCVLVTASLLPAADALEAATADPQQVLDELWPGLVAETPESRRDAEQQWQDFCFQAGSPGREAERVAACRAMGSKLEHNPGAPTTIWLLKQLQFIGGAESVAVVAAQLDSTDPLVRDAARRALAHNPSVEAGTALRDRLKKAADSDRKAGLIGALGFRAEEASVPTLAKLMHDADAKVVAAAAKALGSIGTASAVRSLAEAHKQAVGETRLPISDAYLRCADRLLHDGKTDEAARIYDQLYVPDEPARLAALKGVLQTAGDRASDVVLSVLASGDAAAQQVAIQHVEQIGSAGIRSLAAGRSKLPLDAQIHLISALGIRGDAAGLPTVLAALDSDHHDVRLAALRALGGVGNASAVPRLVQVMQAGNDAGDAARESLETLSAEGVDAKLVEAMQQTDDAARRAQLIEILDRRRDADAVPALLQEILHRDASVRRRAMAALGRLAGEADVAGMIDGLVRVEDGGERDEAEKAITAVCNRIPDETRKGEVLLTIYNRASADDQSSILQVLGRLGGEKPLQTIRTAIADVDVQRHDSGVRAICNWPDSSVAEDLLKLAETDRDQANRVRALRALARVAVLPSERSEESKLQLLKDGMRLAGRDDERKLILDRAREARTVETARFAATFLDDPAVAERACRTIVEIAHRREIRGPHQEEFDKLLARVAQVTKDRGLADRARSYMTQK